MRWLPVIAVTWVVTACSLSSEPLVLADQGSAHAVIVIADDAPPAIAETAADLSDILRRMSGAEIPVVNSTTDAIPLVIGVQPRDHELEPLAYNVWREHNTIYFSGGSERGAINGVYAFLEEEFGCRWYVPGPLGEYLPKRETITVGDVDMQDAPDFKSVTGYQRHRDPEIGNRWQRRVRLVGFPWQMPSHNWQNIVPWNLIDEHPEWFAQLGSGRTPLQMCTTHPDVLDTTIAKARRFFDANPDHPSYSLSPADNMSFCQCENCLALDAELGVDPFVLDGSITDRLVYFFNQVAVEVVKTHPDRRLSFFAYLNHTEPPQVVKPHPMLLPFLVHTPWDYCMHHPIDDPDCERNRPFAEAVVGWHELTPELYVYDYWGHYHLCGHHGVVHNIKRDLPWLYDHGVVGFYGEMHPQWWTQPLNFYVPVKLGWDVNADVDAMVGEFYAHMFGPAALIVAEYAQMFEDVMANVPKDREHDYERAFVHGMTPEFYERAAALLDDADNAVRDSEIAPDERTAIEERLRRYRYGMRLAEQLALVKQNRFAGRMVRVRDHLNAQSAILEEIAADSGLIDMIELPAATRQAIGEREDLPPYELIWEQAVPSAERRAELLQRLDEGHNREVARALGYWSDWYIIGLWNNPGGDPADTYYPPEDEVDLDATYEARSGEIGWRRHQCENAYGIVDLRAYFRPEDSENTTAYAYSDVELREDAGVQMEVTCDDDIVVWVNDELVYSNRTHEARSVGVRLNKGRNRILAKILNKPHGFKFSVRIADENGRPHDAAVWE